VVSCSPAHYSEIDRKIRSAGVDAPVVYMFARGSDIDVRRRANPRWHSNPNMGRAALNFLRSLENAHAGSGAIAHHPWFLYIEPTRNCNLRCPGCHDIGTPIYENMPMSEFKRVVDEAGPYLYHVSLFRGGESLVSKDFFPMLAYLHEHSAANLHISTNLSLKLTDPQLRALAEQMSLLDVCIDGLTQETYEQYRVRGDCALAFDNLARVHQIIEEDDLPCDLRWRFVVFRHNEHEVPEAKERAKAMGVTLQLIPAFLPTADWMADDEFHQRDLYRQEESQTLKIEIENASKAPCLWLHGGSVINHDMSLSPCCELQSDFASIKEKSLATAYDAQNYRAARDAGVCDGCSLAGRREWNRSLKNHAIRILDFIAENSDQMEPDIAAALKASNAWSVLDSI
jgi:MoaA/NifB/PqqE/SkfB family radical SAM enzyme